jgi:hypothetical protein
MMPHPVPQNLQTALSHRQSVSVSSAAAFSLSGTAIPTVIDYIVARFVW